MDFRKISSEKGCIALFGFNQTQLDSFLNELVCSNPHYSTGEMFSEKRTVCDNLFQYPSWLEYHRKKNPKKPAQEILLQFFENLGLREDSKTHHQLMVLCDFWKHEPFLKKCKAFQTFLCYHRAFPTTFCLVEKKMIKFSYMIRPRWIFFAFHKTKDWRDAYQQYLSSYFDTFDDLMYIITRRAEHKRETIIVIDEYNKTFDFFGFNNPKKWNGPPLRCKIPREHLPWTKWLIFFMTE
jgi:hypothetical protein